MIDFVKELTACRFEGTEYPFYPETIEGYTEAEVELIAEYCNINIQGQFREFLLQMGKCSGGLLSRDEFYMYRGLSNQSFLRNFQKYVKQDDEMYDEYGEIDPIEKKIFPLTCVYETYFFYLFTAENDDHVWFLDSSPGAVWVKDHTLLEYLKSYVADKTKQSRFIDVILTKEDVVNFSTSRLL